MEEKGVSSINIVTISVIIALVIVAGCLILIDRNRPITENPSLITKNPSDMMLTLGDLSSNYKLDFEQFVNGPEEAAEQLTPNSVTVWSNWGFEVSCHRTFKDDSFGTTKEIWPSVDRYSSIDGAKSSYEYRKSILSDQLQPMTETIGDESFAAHTTLDLFDIDAVYFIKNNIFVNITVNHLSLTDAILYAHIVESRIQ